MKKNSIRVTIMALLFAMSVNTCFAFLGLPGVDSLNDLNLVAATQVFDINGQLISKLFEENRIVVNINSMSPYIQQAIIANEDTRFYNHFGIDPIGIIRAVVVNIRRGGLVEGGSTITQQLAKNMFLTQERTFIRKVKEAALALVIDYKFSKQEILQAYLNQVYFGEGTYGVEAAAQMYFGKHANELALSESAMLAGLPRGPSIYSPYADMKAATERRAVVLDSMVKEGYITQQEAVRAKVEPVKLAGKKKRVVQASYFLDYVAKELVDRYGANRVYKGGLKVYTTLDISQQQAAEAVLGQMQGAVLALDSKTGYVKAMVGGRNYEESQINRVFAEVRQPGSAFKPFLYATAINQGLTANAIIIDEPININGYSPLNYDKKNRGPITMKKALRWSVNVAAVKLGQQIGIDQVLNLAKTMGITTLTPEDNNLASALGGLTQGVNLWELTTAYTAFANNGVLSKPIAIVKVLDENGQVLEEGRIEQQSVLKPETAYILTDMLRGVVQDGTATPANLGRPAAGKTGTTDNYETAWFIGYTPDIVVGIYVGNDNRKPVSISGTEVSALWGKMLSKIVANTPPTDFPIPPNVVVGIPVCTSTGKLAGSGCKETEYSAFIKGTEPTAPRVNNRIKQWLTPDETQPQSPEQQEQKKQPFWKWPWSRLPSF
ncbi:Penicillin-binding protein 1F [Sporomusa silvacetica DSM 10669]|uniref:Penicillin-binding protein 1F n=1 Tax=Sporomusa silvacetica DSM 10669 TaxID=1123289 RepID=A0ABZ3IL45_9FIRM|nr:PBP1A family penicillin-binding protein [Sporomusa silvacetica]OZC23058.1 penicillin-binding protein 1F [Sporomusa silvacetica DSM 10669]